MSDPGHEPSAQPNIDLPTTTTADDDLLAALTDEFSARLRRGEQPQVEEFAKRHPALAERIRNVFQAVALMEQSRTVDYSGVTERVGATVGRYKLLEQIGEGGFGVVYMAEQQHPIRRKVAVKVVKPGMDSRQVLARFEAERQALAIMDHPNIAKVFDAGATDSGRPYFVMELVRGEPITEFSDRNQLSPRERLGLFAQVCHAVQHAHQKGIIHRDLKPTNVLVAMHDTTPAVKVIDFGVAKALGQELTEKTLVTGFAQFLGTPLYMSPEQAGQSSLDVDTRSDIYSLGVLLYELLTGTTPFDKERFRKAAHDEILRIIRDEEPPKPSTRLSESRDSLPSISAQRKTEPARLTQLVRGELDWIVMKALEKDRSRRYETANGLAADVQRYLANEPVEACRPSTTYRIKKFARRNKGPVLATGLVLLALVAGTIGTTWGMLDARRRSEGERLAKEQAEANFALARETVETYLSTVTLDPELRRSDLNRLRKKLLESAVPFFEKLTDRKSKDPEVEAARGRAFVRLARLRFEMGEDEAALADAHASRQIFTRLSIDDPSVPEHRARLSDSIGITGYILRHLGRHAEAEPAYRQDLELTTKLVNDFPAVPKYRQMLSETCNNLGNLLRDLGKLEEAAAMYQEAVVIGKKLATDFPTVLLYRGHLAGSYQNVATIFAQSGELGKAESACREANALREEIAAVDPEDPDARVDLADGYNMQGIVLGQLGKRDEAASCFRRSVDVGEKLASDLPSVPRYRETLAGAYCNFASTLFDLGKSEDAESACRRAVALNEKLTVEFPNVPNYRYLLFASYTALGDLLGNSENREESRSAYRRAVGIQEKLVAEFPAVLLYAVNLGMGYYNYGLAVQGDGQPEASLDWFQKGITTLEPLVAAGPQLIEGRQALCNCHWGRAYALDLLGRQAEARRDWQRAEELGDDRNKDVFRLRILRYENDSGECIVAATKYEAKLGNDARQLYSAACNRAICAAVILNDPKVPTADTDRLSQEQAELAMAWLRKAVAADFHSARHLMQDTDLDALRERDDFKELVAEWESKKPD